MAAAASGAMRYRDLRIELARVEDRARGEPVYAVRASVPSTELPVAQGELRIPISPGEAEQAIGALAGVTKNWVQRAPTVEALDPIKELGTRLFRAAMSEGQLGQLYQRALALTEDPNTGLCVRLVLGDPDAAAVPWEFVFDAFRQDFVALSMRSPLVREWGMARTERPIEPVEPPLRVLVASAEVVPSAATLEITLLRELATEFSLLEVDFAEDASPKELREHLRRKPYHVLHLIGEGESTSGPDGRPDQVLYLRADGVRPVRGERPLRPNEVARVRPDELAGMLREQPSLRLVSLSGSHSDIVARGLADAVPATLGLRGYATDAVCQVFTDGFYRAILASQPIEAAVTQGRQAIDLRHPGGREWGLLVFYLQGPGGALLAPSRETSTSAAGGDLPDPAQPPDDSNRRREWEKLRSLLGIYERNRVALEQRLAGLGAAAPGPLTAQLDDVRKKIADLTRQLHDLSS